MEALPHGLRMAIQLRGDDAGAQAVPTACDHAGMQHPIGGGMPTTRPLPHLAFFIGIEG